MLPVFLFLIFYDVIDIQIVTLHYIKRNIRWIIKQVLLIL